MSYNHLNINMIRRNGYYPFGMLQPQRNWGDYRFGFNGKENDNEVKGSGNSQDYGMRIYDNRLGRFLSPDPLIVSFQKYPELSTYQFASNSPIWGIDWDGLELRIYTSTQGMTGHTFLSVGKGKDLVVYSYGQYGKPKYSTLGGFSPQGQGVLYRLTGERARNFVKQYVKYEGAKAYEINDADENKVKQNMDAQFNAGTPATEGRAKGDENAKVINNTYDLFDDNCATNTCDGAQSGGTNLDFKIKGTTILPTSSVPGIPGQVVPTSNSVNTPGKMGTYLNNESNKKDSKVVDVTGSTGTEVENKPK